MKKLMLYALMLSGIMMSGKTMKDDCSVLNEDTFRQEIKKHVSVIGPSEILLKRLMVGL